MIETGTGSQGGVLGGDDGTGPQPFDSKHAPAPACSRYSPPWAEACATRHDADNRAIRRVWAHFAAIANSRAANQEALVALLAPRTCGLNDDADRHGVIHRRGDCRRVVRSVLRATAEQPLLANLDDIYVEADRAVSRTKAPGSTIRFSRVNGAWLIREI